MTGSINIDENITGTLQVDGTISGVITIGKAKLDDITVKSTTQSQTVLPEEGYDGFGSVTVSPLSLQTKSVMPSVNTQNVTADSGYDGLASVEVGPLALQSKSVTPGATAQTVTPDTGFDGLSSVTVGAAAGGDFVLDFNLSWKGVVEDYMFKGMTGITGVTFKINNDNLTIGKYAFQNCTGIRRVEIPVCQNIGSNAFINCSNYELYVGASTMYGSAVIPMQQATDIGDPTVIHIPWDMEQTYKNDAVWGVLSSKMVADYFIP